ncbi:hypothetical protein COCHEDRAFT_1020488, partial [Bipolaris maydis C5]
TAPLFNICTVERWSTAASCNACLFLATPNLICRVRLYGKFTEHIDEKSATFGANPFS